MKLVIIRHPKPEVPKGLCYGQSDVPLIENWQADAKAIAQFMDKCYPEHNFAWYHSPLTRTQLLAYALAPQSTPVDALKEVDFGRWENCLWSDIPKADIDAWRDDLMQAAPYEGESLAVLQARVLAWFEPLIEADKDVVLVTHSGVIKVLVAALCQFSMTECFRLNPTYSSITELDLGPGFALLNRLGAGDWARG
ncbi:histidine phosphatase family protein [Marinomonas ostreistagni]|uniref:histidine phosphatase family protein n=1 Tax=Marinomonas ostreistagni TaxID=359209 RepID=UPI001950F5B1|nr:histidine phosphatase family protein [Marinomonas ostreistagni]MBM6549606.1 histidine phosphatase family protein [Marinomonas ostreistagni]